MCKGCIRHECEVNGKKEILNPPESYIRDIQLSGYEFGSTEPTVNVGDNNTLMHFSKWCSMVPNK